MKLNTNGRKPLLKWQIQNTGDCISLHLLGYEIQLKFPIPCLVRQSVKFYFVQYLFRSLLTNEDKTENHIRSHINIFILVFSNF